MDIFNNLPEETRKEFTSIIIEELEHNCLPEETILDRYSYITDLHQKLFNEDYFIVGYYNSEQFIKNNFDSTFEAIDIVKTYEVEHFGEFTTSLNSESICNMLACIIGEELIYSLNEDSTIEELINNLKKY